MLTRVYTCVNSRLACPRLGFSQLEINAMSMQVALLIHFQATDAVDTRLGEGTYRALSSRATVGSAQFWM